MSVMAFHHNRRPDLASMGIVAARFDDAMKAECLTAVIRCFKEVSSLRSMEVRVGVELPKGRFGPLSYSCTCSVELTHVPSVLMLPQLDHGARKVNVVELFSQRGGRTDDQFRQALGSYFSEVWPALDDHAHLFGGVGSFTLTRDDIDFIADGCDSAEIYQRFENLVNRSTSSIIP